MPTTRKDRPETLDAIVARDPFEPVADDRFPPLSPGDTTLAWLQVAAPAAALAASLYFGLEPWWLYLLGGLAVSVGLGYLFRHRIVLLPLDLILPRRNPHVTRPGEIDSDDFVEHPRYCRAPRPTGLDPSPDDEDVVLHWRTRSLLAPMSPWTNHEGAQVVRGTAIRADLSHRDHVLPLTHYFDHIHVCRSCARRFVFFAEEQKYWYETLDLPLDAIAVRCPPCRKKLREVQRLRARYEELFHVDPRSADESLEMAECCLTLVEESVFHPRQIETVRGLLRGLPEEGLPEERRDDERTADLWRRVRAAEEPPEAPDESG